MAKDVRDVDVPEMVDDATLKQSMDTVRRTVWSAEDGRPLPLHAQRLLEWLDRAYLGSRGG